MIKVSVVGATGYTGEELVAILASHKDVKIVSLSAIIDKPTNISDLFPRLKGRVDVVCKSFDFNEAASSSDVIFLALPHRVSMDFAPKFLNAGKKVIDLSADYRLPSDLYEKWYGKGHADAKNIAKAVYGLPELFRSEIKKADLIANPGCYPTSVILAVAPLIKSGGVQLDNIIADSKSGITGAGRKASIDLLFGEIADNFKAYKIGAHQHMPEMIEILKNLAGRDVDILFAPHVIPIKRGILSTVYTKPIKKIDQKEVNKIYSDFYKNEFFVRFKSDTLPEIKDVAYTNFCDIGVRVTDKNIVAVSVIDNLLKGAAGQAVQNMNIMFGFDEKEGLV
ncbi:MAG: N-acetyl-gamma-glutamyl-phosphate reductase [Candidatus Omnitrophica bacterium]|nr:N-acetyl-gamma-glutamyl-phosphate reductase [Candidatus Omnitrophota bacterium]MBU4488928.1 N-acetyl-gamma-glutamyl-phosphate reductase [Candidatus Omnitrophota bacterium]MCG2705324.1 N-acetyl-gamma-glutamyl-phosphate reductase [Candidatus Omnitrophota bacterium]